MTKKPLKDWERELENLVMPAGLTLKELLEENREDWEEELEIIKHFISSLLSEVLEGLKMKEEDEFEGEIKTVQDRAEAWQIDGFNQAVRKLNTKLDNLIGEK